MSDPKKTILARRAKFVAAAIAGITIACGKDPAPPPQPCLSEPYNPDAEPMPCLTPVVANLDAEATAQDAGGAEAAAPKDASTPVPCLSVRPIDAGPKPTVCLKVAPPKSSP